MKDLKRLRDNWPNLSGHLRQSILAWTSLVSTYQYSISTLPYHEIIKWIRTIAVNAAFCSATSSCNLRRVSLSISKSCISRLRFFVDSVSSSFIISIFLKASCIMNECTIKSIMAGRVHASRSFVFIESSFSICLNLLRRSWPSSSRDPLLSEAMANEQIDFSWSVL